jgi:hypothetical protein
VSKWCQRSKRTEHSLKNKTCRFVKQCRLCVDFTAKNHSIESTTNRANCASCSVSFSSPTQNTVAFGSLSMPPPGLDCSGLNLAPLPMRTQTRAHHTCLQGPFFNKGLAPTAVHVTHPLLCKRGVEHKNNMHKNTLCNQQTW